MSSLVAMPSARGLSNLGNLVNRDAMAEAIREGKSAEYADKVGQLFQHWGKIEDAAQGNMTLTGAYVHRASRDANGGTVDAKAVNERLGVQTSTRFGYVARLHFDLDFSPEDGAEWTQAVKAADKDKDFRALLNRTEPNPATKQEVLDYLARKAAEREAGTTTTRKAKTDAGDKGEEKAKGEDKGMNVVANNGNRNDAIAQLLASWEASEASASDVAGLMANMVRAQSLLRFVPAAVLAEGKAILAKDDTATPATVAKRKGASATSAK